MEQGGTTDWERARGLFLDFADLEKHERTRALADLAADDPELADWVARLLEHDCDADGDLVELDAEFDPLPDEAFGPYRVVERIGAGGMGEVYLGRRSDGEFERQVAIKCMRPGGAGEQLVQRFLRERQTLARLDHEYIARLIDGGTTENGRPYFVLEYVRGRQIDHYCKQEALGVRARVELFMKVLEAVQYAHARGVVHRDLKPGNILVREDGEPRLLDFGIARTAVEGATLEPLTGTGQRLFTPDYASPEQVRGETATEASDLFALGVLLYRLLAGVGPWKHAGSMFALEKSILERDPVPPSQHLEGRDRRLVAGDLDTIVLHCLHKQPESRFASVQALSAELDRHLRGFPIETRPTRFLGRLVRHGRRNPWAALATVLLVVSLVVVAIAWRSDRAAANRRKELVSSLVVSLEYARSLQVLDKYGEAVVELRSILEKLDGVPEELELRIETLAELCGALFRTHEPEESFAVVEQGLALVPDEPGRFAHSKIKLLNVSVACHRALQDLPRATAAAEAAYTFASEWLEPGDAGRIEAIQALAIEATSMPLEERIAILSDGVEEARARDGDADGVLSSILLLQGNFLGQKGDFEGALACYDESLEIDRKHHGDSHGDIALVRHCRGDALRMLNRLEEARGEFEAAFEVFEARSHRDMAAIAKRRLGEVHAAQGDYATALDALIEARELHAAFLGDDHATVREIEGQIAQVEGQL